MGIYTHTRIYSIYYIIKNNKKKDKKKKRKALEMVGSNGARAGSNG